jgi:NitT/TauT family transport system permease protein
MKNRLLALFPLIVFLALWQWAANASTQTQFLLGSPLLVVQSLWTNLLNGELPRHTAVTCIETLAGFVIGVSCGSLLGFLLLYHPRAAAISRGYVVAAGAIPPFALAPLMIIWFGVGIGMKIACAAFATVFVALAQAYQGGRAVPQDLSLLFDQFEASRRQRFFKLVLPSALDWLLNSFRLNISLALMGAFIGEFIMSDAGLGHVLLKAGGLYDIPLVWAATLCIVLLAVTLNGAVAILEKNRLRLIQRLTVPAALR